MPEPLLPRQFDALLQRLGPDPDSAGTRYEQLRRRLVAVFEYRRCREAEQLADETLDRAARKLAELGADFVGSDPARFIFGIAWNVARESFRRPTAVPLPEGPERPQVPERGPAAKDDPELYQRCLDHCLDLLPSADRNLCLEYHAGDGSERIRRRSELAGELGMSPNALRLRISRLKTRLRDCVAPCVDGQGRPGFDARP